jgi:uncharacterized protein
MRPSSAIACHRDRVLARLRVAPVRNPRIFGSVINGSDHEGSDLDLLVEAIPGTTLFELGALQLDLEDILGVPVDLLTEGDLPASFRGSVLAQAKPV